jgi:hypothetical protein
MEAADSTVSVLTRDSIHETSDEQYSAATANDSTKDDAARQDFGIPENHSFNDIKKLTADKFLKHSIAVVLVASHTRAFEQFAPAPVTVMFIQSMEHRGKFTVNSMAMSLAQLP